MAGGGGGGRREGAFIKRYIYNNIRLCFCYISVYTISIPSSNTKPSRGIDGSLLETKFSSISGHFSGKLKKTKKVLLLERKRHTACCVAALSPNLSIRGGVPPCSLDGGGVPHPVLTEGIPSSPDEGGIPSPCQEGWGTPIGKIGYPPREGWGTPASARWDYPLSPASVNRLKVLPSLSLRMRAVKYHLKELNVFYRKKLRIKWAQVSQQACL